MVIGELCIQLGLNELSLTQLLLILLNDCYFSPVGVIRINCNSQLYSLVTGELFIQLGFNVLSFIQLFLLFLNDCHFNAVGVFRIDCIKVNLIAYSIRFESFIHLPLLMII